MSTTTKEQVKEYYDTFKEHQKKLGINIRHRTILKNLKSAGLKPDSNILEVGCGIGTVSHLILKYITQGSFVGLDISSESIKMAQQFNAFHKKAEFFVDDMSNFTHKTKFDFVVFPDVLEHIPVEQHANIFKTIGELTTPNAVVLINIPEPNYLNWVRANDPAKLQIIDQSLSMQDLLNNSYPYGFKLYSMNPYSLHFDVNDYLAIVLKKDMTVKNVNVKNKIIRAIENTKSKLA
ncbi:MAG: class I SAM-dependent methyltransferase [Burkholderiales bacterium]|nr:class I SAM-dependent methyltransferase [Bacteroidia bacterium]